MRAARETIAACLIVKDEQERLPDALASVAFCDEVVVVDSGSRDDTLEIARAAGARVAEHDWAGFGAQRNVAIDLATADWILEVDADERITPELAEELLEFLAAPPAGIDVAVLPMREWFLGRLLGPSIKYPRYRTRLFRRGVYRHDERRRVHEGIWPEGPTWVAKSDMQHVLASSAHEALGDWWRYARLESAHVPQLSGPPAYAVAIIARPLAKLGYRVVVDQGWRDGPTGLLKIALDCASDALVWTRRLLRRGGATASERGDGHFGRGEPGRGPVRLVALAAGEDEAARAIEWLESARTAGADVALITDASAAAARWTGGNGWRAAIELQRFRLRPLMRALDAAEQVRPIDALALAPGGKPERMTRRVPGALRGAAPSLSFADDPGDAAARVTELTRGRSAAC
jgi:(heptosyl)LPS beta-1,4-glucosyltransferase